MNFLLDTHTMLWWLNNDPDLSDNAYKVISDGKNMIFVSAASIWEIRIKEALGKLIIPKNFKEKVKEQSFEMLSITTEHAHEISGLPLLHRDPFDRMLIAQARYERLTIISRDPIIKKYKVPVIIS